MRYDDSRYIAAKRLGPATLQPSRPARRRQGFTIVELLIVIVVIAILAAITIVAYNGIQTRAYYSRLSSSVKTYAQALAMYKIDHGAYPSADWKCLGRLEDYPATSDFGEGVCLTNGSYKEIWDSAIADDITGYISTPPNPNYPTASDEFGNRVRGLEYDSQTSGYANPTITFYMKGNVSCPIGHTGYYYSSYNSVRCTYELPA